MAADSTAIAAVRKELEEMKAKYSQDIVQVCTDAWLPTSLPHEDGRVSLLRNSPQTAQEKYEAALDEGNTAREVCYDCISCLRFRGLMLQILTPSIRYFETFRKYSGFFDYR